jgi:CheY-like chemotaxis protein
MARLRPGAMPVELGMPGSNGEETAERIRRRPWGKGIPPIAVTGGVQPECSRGSLAAGLDPHLLKPLALERLGDLSAGPPERARRGEPSESESGGARRPKR